MKQKEQQPEVARLVADIPVELKRKIAAYANLRGYGIKDVIIEMAEAYLSKISPEEQKLIDNIVDHQRARLSKAA